jgi:gliding motility-associated-like protein
MLVLEATSSIENPTNYNWVSGQVTPSITIDTAGVYEVEVSDGCAIEIITFNVSLIENPVIESIVSDRSSITINVSGSGDYLYSLNGVDYQFTNVFSNMPIDLYTVYVKSNDCEVIVTQEHLHFFIPRFMTPNGDGVNDVFSLNVSKYFTSTEVCIFDRYGKLLFSAINRDVNWDGTVNGKKLPTSDYWYRIVIDGKEYKGHLTIKN